MPEHPAITVSYTKTLDLQILSCLQCTMLQVSPKSAEFVRDTSFSISSTLYVTACIHPPREPLLIFFPLQSVYINISLRIDFIRNLQYSNTMYVYSVLCDWNVELSMWVEPWWNVLPPLSIKVPDDQSYFDTRSTWSRTISPVCVSPDAEWTPAKEQCITWPRVNSCRATVMWLANRFILHVKWM